MALISPKIGKRASVLTAFDQAMVSGSNFLTGVLLVRGLGLHVFGEFTVAYTILLFANSLQLSFVSAPMVTLAPQFPIQKDKDSYLHGMFGVQSLFCLALYVAWIPATMMYLTWRPGQISAGFVWPYTSTIALFLMQDWLRRYYFCSYKAHEAIWNDGLSYVGQVIVLAVLFWRKELTLVSAYWTIAITSGIAMVLGILRERLNYSWPKIQHAWRHSVSLGRNLAMANILQWLGSQGVLLSGAGVLGAREAGGVRAAQNLLGPVHVAYQALENIVPIRASEEAMLRGIDGVRKYLRRFTIFGLMALTAMFLPVALFSKSILGIIYGPATVPFWTIVILQLGYLWIGLPWRQCVYLFRTIGKSHYLVWANTCASLVAFGSVFLYMRHFGAAGIVMATLTGELTGLGVMTVQAKRLYASLRRETVKN